MRRFERSVPACLAAAAALAACEPAAEGGNVAVAEPAATGPATSAAEAEALVEARADAANFRWTGRFAATRELCTGGVWDIREDRIVTDGHTACDVDRVGRGAGQVTLRLACIAEGTPSQENWTLTRHGEDGVSVARNTGTEIIDVDLLRCG